MRLLPKSRRGRAAGAVGLAALVASGVYWYLDEYRPWEQPRYLGLPLSWWDRELTRWRERGEPAPAPPGWPADWLRSLGVTPPAPAHPLTLFRDRSSAPVPIFAGLLDSPDPRNREEAITWL